MSHITETTSITFDIDVLVDESVDSAAEMKYEIEALRAELIEHMKRMKGYRMNAVRIKDIISPTK